MDLRLRPHRFRVTARVTNHRFFHRKLARPTKPCDDKPMADSATPRAYHDETLTLTFRVLGAFIFIMTAAALAVRFPIAAGVPLCVLAPAWVLVTGRVQGFARLKLATLLISRSMVPLAVLGLFPGPLAANIVLFFYRINIAEAVVEDFRKRHWANGCAGAVVLFFTAFVHVEWMQTYYLVYPAPFLCAAIAYTIWNFNFVSLNFPPSTTMLHAATLTAPLFLGAAYGDMGIWLITRATSLTIAIVITSAFARHVEENFSHPGHANWIAFHRKGTTQWALAIATALFTAAALWLRHASS